MREQIKQERTEVLNEIAPDQLSGVISDFTDSGAINVIPTRQPSGNFQVKAVFEKMVEANPAVRRFFKA